MNTKRYLTDAVLIFAVTFVVSIAVTFLYNFIAHGYGIVDWESSFRFGLILGIALPFIQQKQKKG